MRRAPKPLTIAVMAATALGGLPAFGACATSVDPVASVDRGTADTLGAGAPEGGRNDPQTATSPTGAAALPDPGELPQTEDRPQATSPLFERNVAGLWDAIVSDDPASAMPFFFPLAAYKQVKAMADPASDYQNRLIRQYKADIHTWHNQLGKAPANAKFTGIDVPTAQATWMKPGSEYNKIGYYRVLSSKLNYTVDGQKKSFTIASLISWRGEWYAVHLVAIK